MKAVCFLIVGLTLVAAADVVLRKNHQFSVLNYNKRLQSV